MAPNVISPLPWAAPRTGVSVERRDASTVFAHGARAGLLAGLSLGVVEMAASALLRGDPWLPFDFAAAIVVGPDALARAFPLGASVALGVMIHLLLSLAFGVAFLGLLALGFQLSARPALVLLYGVLFALLVWEVNFLAVLPLVAPEMAGQLDLAMQVWNGIASYGLAYGPTLAAYVILVRPGVVDRWWIDDEEAP